MYVEIWKCSTKIQMKLYEIWNLFLNNLYSPSLTSTGSELETFHCYGQEVSSEGKWKEKEKLN